MVTYIFRVWVRNWRYEGDQYMKINLQISNFSTVEFSRSTGVDQLLTKSMKAERQNPLFDNFQKN